MGRHCAASRWDCCCCAAQHRHTRSCRWRRLFCLGPHLWTTLRQGGGVGCEVRRGARRAGHDYAGGHEHRESCRGAACHGRRRGAHFEIVCSSNAGCATSRECDFMKMLQMADDIRYRTMTTEELREAFLLSDLFQPGQICLTYVDLDRTVIGSAVPVGKPLTLPA